MGIIDWINVESLMNGLAVISSRNVLTRFTPGVLDFRRLLPQYFVWSFVCLALFAGIKNILLRCSPTYASFNPKRKTTVIIHVIELLVISTSFCILTYGMSDALLGTTPQLIGNVTMQPWDENLQWIDNLNKLTLAVGYGAYPLLTWYTVSLFILSTSNTTPPVPLVIHHSVTIFFGLLLVQSAFACLDLATLRLAYVMLLHATLEQPLFLSLLIHRFKLVERLDIVWLSVAIYTFIVRLVLTAASFYFYAQICWLRVAYNSWSLFFRWFLPPFFLILFGVQLYIVYIYVILWRRFRPIEIQLKEEEEAEGEELKNNAYKNFEKLEIININDNKTNENVNNINQPVPFSRQARLSRISQRQIDAEKIVDDLTASKDIQRIRPVNPNGDTTDPPKDENTRHLEKTLNELPKDEIAFDKRLSATIFSVFWLTFMILFFALFLQSAPYNCKVELVTPKKIGIVGGGISGMAAAWRLAEVGHDVTIYESEPRLGGHAATYYTQNGSAVDLGFRYFKDDPNFRQLLKFLNFSDVSLVSFYANRNLVLGTGVPPPTILITPYSPIYIPELQVFVNALENARGTYSEKRWMTETLGTFLDLHNFTQDFIMGHVLVQLSLYVPTSQSLLDTPLGLISLIDQKYRVLSDPSPFLMSTFKNGSYSYISVFEAVLVQKGVKIEKNKKVDKLIPSSGMVRLILENGDENTFDQVISTGRISDIASRERDTTNSLKRKIFGLEGNIGVYPSNQTVSVVCGVSEIIDFQIWNQTCKNIPPISLHVSPLSKFAILYNVANSNRLCYNGDSTSLFLGKNGTEQIIPVSGRIFTKSYTLPSHTSNFLLVGRNFHKIQGSEKIWYAGGDVSSVLSHESAFVSGLVVAKQIGASFPWTEDALSAAHFIGLENWIMWGINYFALPLME